MIYRRVFYYEQLCVDMRSVFGTPGYHRYGSYQSLSYVKYQPVAMIGGSGLNGTYADLSDPYAALAYTVSDRNFSYHLGLGGVSRVARANNFGSIAFDPIAAYGGSSGEGAWQRYGGAGVMNIPEDASRMHNSSESIHLTFKFSSLQPGEVVHFAFFYLAKDAYETAALQSVSVPLLLQPMDGVSGSNALFAAMATNYAVLSCNFSIFAGVWHTLGVVSYDAASNITLCSLEADTRAYPDGTSHLFVSMTTTGGIFTAERAVVVDNSGAAWCFIRPGSGSLELPQDQPLSVEVAPCSAGESIAGATVTFFKEYYMDGEVNSSVVAVVSSGPYVASVSVSEVPVGSVVYVRAVASNSTQSYTAVIAGSVVASPTSMPSSPVLRGSFCDGEPSSAMGPNCTAGDVSLAGES